MRPPARLEPIADALNRYSSKPLAAVRFVAQRGILKSVVWGATRVSVHGRHRLDGLDGAWVAVANHSSHLDAPLVMGSLPRRQARYLAAGAAADYFFDVWWRRGLTALFFNAFPIDRRGQIKRAGMSKALLNHGIPLLVFPEGTRSRTGEVGEFSPGAAGLALACDVPVVPIGLVGASDAMPRGASWIAAGRPVVHVVIGEPMHPRRGENAAAFTVRVRAEVQRLRSTVTGRGVRRLGRPERGIA